jgi:hypothetical protein
LRSLAREEGGVAVGNHDDVVGGSCGGAESDMSDRIRVLHCIFSECIGERERGIRKGSEGEIFAGKRGGGARG